MIMFGHSISTKRQFLFCLLMKCPNIITSAHFEPLVNCIHTHTHMPPMTFMDPTLYINAICCWSVLVMKSLMLV